MPPTAGFELWFGCPAKGEAFCAFLGVAKGPAEAGGSSCARGRCPSPRPGTPGPGTAPAPRRPRRRGSCWRAGSRSRCSFLSLRTVSSWNSSVRGLVEVKVAAEDLVAALAGEHHLDAHGLDLARQQVHGRRGADRGDVEALEVVDDVRQGVEAFLDGEVDLVVVGCRCGRPPSGRGQVRARRAGPPRTVDPRPPGRSRSSVSTRFSRQLAAMAATSEESTPPEMRSP